MAIYAAFLRGINVGGHRITTQEFKDCFGGLGFTDVATFRASGNVIFTAGSETIPAMTKSIERGLDETFGYAVPTFLRTAAAVAKIAAHKPFGAKSVAASKGKLQVVLLRRAPSKTARDKVLAMATDADQLTFKGSELYWLPKGGTMETELDFKAIGKLLGEMTTRTKGTVDQIASKYFGS